MHSATVQAQTLGTEFGPTIKNRAIARASGNAGDVLQFDLANSNGSVDNNTPNDKASGLANLIAPSAEGVKGLPCCIALTDYADGQEIPVLRRGVTDAFVIKSSGNIAVGDLLAVDTSRNLSGLAAGGSAYRAVALEAKTGPSTRTTAKVFFDGTGLKGSVNTTE